LFGARAGLVAGVLYVVSPFALVYDRLALSDGFLAAALAGVMFATRVLTDDPRRLGPWVGLVVASTLAIVSKVSALLFLPAVPLAALLLAKERRSSLVAGAMAVAAALVCASPMLWFFAANSGEIASQHVADRDLSGSMLMATLRDIWGWLRSYFGIPVLLAGAASIAWLRDGRALWLGGSFVLPLVLFALLSEPWSARYILPTLPSLLILISGGIETVCARLNTGRAGVAALGLALAISLQGLVFDVRLFVDPSRAPFPADDRHQLVTGWPSGYGVREAARRLEKESEAGAALVFVDTGGTRTLSTSLAVLLAGHPRLSLVEGDFATSATREAIAAEAARVTVFAILGPRSPGLDFRSLMEGVPVERVEVYERPGGEWAATLFRVGVGSQR
jgi:4-amino-4-deoxy-L-arabinose transferase-like glycosyltransferase